MAYEGAKLSRLTQGQIGGGFSIWRYEMADSFTVVRVDGYITDAAVRGMRKGDLVVVGNPAATPPTNAFMNVTAVNANGSGDLSDGLVVTATDTD
jgi:hypothetical protein